MKNIDEFLKYSDLFSEYKELLTSKQKLCMSAFFEEDNSFSEIAEALDISRQAVFENIKKACIKLDEFESKLKIITMKKNYLDKLEALYNDFDRKHLEKIIKELKGY